MIFFKRGSTNRRKGDSRFHTSVLKNQKSKLRSSLHQNCTTNLQVIFILIPWLIIYWIRSLWWRKPCCVQRAPAMVILKKETNKHLILCSIKVTLCRLIARTQAVYHFFPKQNISFSLNPIYLKKGPYQPRKFKLQRISRKNVSQ